MRRAAVVLLAGLAALVLVLGCGAQHRAAGPPRSPRHLKPRQTAFKVAREFLETAVLRKRLHYAYTLVAHDLKAGISRKEWETGKNQVIPYPARNASTARFRVLRSTKKRLYLQTRLVPRPKSGMANAYTFYMEVRHIQGKWLVDYFVAEDPYSSPPPGAGY